MVEAPGTAPGSERLITVAFIAIAGRIRPAEYMLAGFEIKVPQAAAFQRPKRAIDDIGRPRTLVIPWVTNRL